jgi:integrase
MSRRTKLVHEVVSVADRHEGSQQHKTNLREIWDPYSRFLRDIGICPKRVKEIPALGPKLYVQLCVARGTAVGSIHNRTSGIRVVMKRAGKDIDHLTNAVLGVPRRDRNGKKVPLSREEQIEVHEKAHRIDEGFGLLTEFQSGFGLRGREALLSPPDLQAWHQALANGESTIHVERGCKGGRPREVSVLEARRPEMLSVLARAIDYCHRHNGRLVTGRGGDLRSSLNRLKGLYRRAGLTGERSGHALRHGYACEMACQRFDRKESEHEVLVGVASDLGHGEKRGRFTLVTYLRSIIERFARVFRNGRLFKKAKDIQPFSPGPAAQQPGPTSPDTAQDSGNKPGTHACLGE